MTSDSKVNARSEPERETARAVALLEDPDPRGVAGVRSRDRMADVGRAERQEHRRAWRR